MLALQLTAIVLILVSAALMFGPQLVIYGPRIAPTLAQDGSARLVGGGLTAALIMAIFGTQLAGDPASGGEVIRIVMTDGSGLFSRSI